MSNSVNLGTVGISGGIAISGFPTPAVTQTIVSASSNTNHAAAGTPVLCRNTTGGKVFYLTQIAFYQTNNGAMPQYLMLYDNATLVYKTMIDVQRTATNNAFGVGYVNVHFAVPLAIATSLKIDASVAMGTVYNIHFIGYEQ